MSDVDGELDLPGLTVEGLYDIIYELYRTRAGDESGYFLIGFAPNERLPVEEFARYNSFGPLWERFKAEFRTLLCTKDKKYSSLRKSFSGASHSTQLTIVSTISAAIGSSLGLAAGSLVPMCALCLIALLKKGKEAFCRGKALDITMGPEE
jgi:hypothetical protein